MPEEKKEIKYAGFWIRFLAFVIDSIIISIVFSPILDAIFPAKEIPFNWRYLNQEINSKYLYSSGANVRNVIFMIYSIMMLYYYNTTLGKMMLGLKVTDEDGKKPELLNLVIRETIGKFLSAIVILLGFITAGFDSKKQAWHDKLAKTYVVYGKTSLKK